MANPSGRPTRVEHSGWRSTWGRALPWVPRFMILAPVSYFGILFLLGGVNRAQAWYKAPVVLPALGIVILLGTGLYALIKRRVNQNTLLTGCLCILCLPLAIPRFLRVAYPASITSTIPAATVRLPANVPLKVMWGGDTLEVNYHAIAYSERWAYDFVVAPYFSGSAHLNDYGCYGVPVVAPGSGTITEAHDGEPDELPGRLSNNQNEPMGNYVAIRLNETGTYLILAHLKPGSLLVQAGETVEEGQVIGQCGNSGNSSEPHIHIHHQRQGPSQIPPGLGEGLPLYFRDQNGDPMPQGGCRMVAGKVIWTGATVQSVGEK